MPGQVVLRGRVHKIQPKRPKGLSAADREIMGQFSTRSSASTTQVALPGFLRLPGELRNQIYNYSLEDQDIKQALLVHRPRRANLRHRHRPTSRPYYGLTQVCRVLRNEYRPLHLKKQEIGLDLTDANGFIAGQYNTRQGDAGHCGNGNFTFALNKTVPDKEKYIGVDIWPALNMWANSGKVEAGFGRYMHQNLHGYDHLNDGEAKDLYRLLGRIIDDNGNCSTLINGQWRAVLQGLKLAKVIVVRAPRRKSKQVPPAPRGTQMVQVAPYSPLFRAEPLPITAAPRAPPGVPFIQTTTSPLQWFQAPTAPQHPATVQVLQPYIRILFKYQHRESWMTPNCTYAPFHPLLRLWLRKMGFADMEFFEVQVGYTRSSSRRTATKKNI
ncbi:hypothetical protein BDV96DRAFT_642783 [Lophiotrema nucula]|uniref:F-box domain-containing protein n=1 Tax=Lophiotrema nucula TaxID=690887 RepID=A0A6A5ZLR3_9PLEO|nr:hypothetical protein BDV96DRAFT_642783 [Lophiotrema nucula]